MNSDAAVLQLAMIFAVFAGSLAVWSWLSIRWNSPEGVLPFASRRPVPWGPVGLIAAILLVAMAAMMFVAKHTNPPQANAEFSKNFIEAATIQGAVLILITLCGAWALWFFSRASWRDLGLPTSLGELVTDILQGVLTFLALILPVFIAQLLLVAVFGQPSANPLIERMRGGVDVPLLVVAVFTASIVAPIFEEFVFRLLLQGWLEKIEWRHASKNLKQETATNPDGTIEGPFTDFSAQPGYYSNFDTTASDSGSEFDPPRGEDESPWASPQTLSTPSTEESEDKQEENLPTAQSTQGLKSWGGLAFGLPSILITAGLFSLAHLGNGPDPIPLFLFGLIVGYVYQRTHRILPCILAHAFFNGFSIVLLTLELAKEPPAAASEPVSTLLLWWLKM